ncbi:GNAT family N-acetyltransferase [Rhodobacteraceae bacterium HSP-20]|uniref:GNAT family N-acetyltransferase n=1 Tax=Paragemmobacter amnigenus TaxID=2852097 RepID=A0ABS6J1Y3_9RHOB|nr:GNAT family N-acetyltransferase [Rhodobacter amnigenus]MBU9697608.1 GNAT family N-acetyltransferase [Rhodobacter amnigenus]MBV4388835.1 GNAT family N-acetyltransferase [Rhodobacter amnigenus]
MGNLVRLAYPEDAAMIAAIHVTSWHETYPGLLPRAEIDRHDTTSRRSLWQAAIASGHSRIAVIPDIGFAAMGRQRDPSLADDYPDELLALYVLRQHHGQHHGRALLSAVRGHAPFTAWVLSGNTRAQDFYARLGARELRRESEVIDRITLTDILLSFPSLPDSP